MRLFWVFSSPFIPFRLHCSDYLGRIISDESPLGKKMEWRERRATVPDFELSVLRRREEDDTPSSTIQLFNKREKRVVKIEVVSFLFPSSILKGGKKLLFWHAVPLPTIQDGLEWEEPDIRLKQASWDRSLRHNLLLPNYYSNSVWKWFSPFTFFLSDKCFLLSFESPWKWQKQCNKVLVFVVDLASFFQGGSR